MSQHAIANAQAWFESIREMEAAYETADAKDEPERSTELDQAITTAIESALSVQVRSGWYSPGGDAGKPAEYEILLTTGGPALRIVGDLNEHDEPESATLEWQDWGTPWTLWGPGASYEGDHREILLSFASHFYFGE